VLDIPDSTGFGALEPTEGKTGLIRSILRAFRALKGIRGHWIFEALRIDLLKRINEGIKKPRLATLPNGAPSTTVVNQGVLVVFIVPLQFECS